MVVASALTIDRKKSAARIERDIETLAGPEYTASNDSIRRYAYTDVYRNTLDYFTRELKAIGFDVYEDPIGTLVGRNRPAGDPVFGVGSHCDSNRNGGRYDGTMGVATALEVCRLNQELGLGLPLQLISFLEEEGSGFGQVLLGSRIVMQKVTEEDLRQNILALDDGRPFWDHAKDAGHEPERWEECTRILDDLTGWIELHIEQARVLQDTGDRLGIVNAIAGIVHADVVITGRADHAGATPMDFRLDPGVVAGECLVELERLATKAGKGTVGTIGEIRFEPGIINVVPGSASFSLDIRGVDEDAFRGVARDIAAFAERTAAERGMSAQYVERQFVPSTPMNERVVGALEEAMTATGEPFRLMPSGAGHDTQLVAPRIPSAMIFVPCKDGISHAPAEEAYPPDAALAAEAMLNAIRNLSADLAGRPRAP